MFPITMLPLSNRHFQSGSSSVGHLLWSVRPNLVVADAGRDLHFPKSLSDNLPIRHWHVRRLLNLLVSPALFNPVPTLQVLKVAGLSREGVVLMMVL